jgi:hypothetical protein
MNEITNTPGPGASPKRAWEAPTIRQWDVKEATQVSPNPGTTDGFIYS